jgi:hypothetical protein
MDDVIEVRVREMTTKSVHETFSKDLAAPEFVAFYLEECLADSPELFLKALGDVAKARQDLEHPADAHAVDSV